jgi:putative ABC transport system permease protein
MSGWWRRIRRRDALERELDAELRDHLERRAHDLAAEGMSADEARRAARLEFGGLDQIKELCRDARGTRWFEDLIADGRYALRLLRKDRGFAAVAIAALGVGIAVNNTQFTIVDAYCLRGLPIPHADRVLYLATRGRQHGFDAMSYADFIDVRRAVTMFGEMTASATVPVSLGDTTQAADGATAAFVSIQTLSLLGHAPLIGRDFRDEDSGAGPPLAVLLAYRVWQRRYDGDPSIVGRTIRINGSPAVVVGVMPEGFTFPDHADVWIPLERMPGLLAAGREKRTLSVFGRLREGITPAQARAELDAIGSRLASAHPDADADATPSAVPINVRYSGRITDPAWMAFTIVGALVVVIACANVANLMLMRSAVRAREVAMRLALGATRLRIVRQLLVESATLAAAGGLLGLTLSAAALRIFIHAVPAAAIPYGGLSMNARVLAVLCVVTMGTVLLFGLVPAFGAVPADVGGALKTGSLSVTHDTRVRRWTAGFLTVEFGLTVLLVSAVGLSVATFRRAEGPAARIDRDHLLTLRFGATSARYAAPAARRDLYHRLADRVAAVPGVSAVTFTDAPALAALPMRVEREEDGARGPVGALTVPALTIDGAYFRVLGLPLTAGRSLDARADDEVIVNERLAHLLASDGAAIGRRIRVAPPSQKGGAAPWLTIVGIAPDLRQPPGGAPDPIVYLPFAASLPTRPVLFIRTAGDPATLAPLVREQVRGLDPDLPIAGLETARQLERDAGWNARISQNIIMTIACIAVALAAVGLYAVTAYGVARRTREIGIRVALGARPSCVIWLVLRGALRQIAAGLAAGFLLKHAWARLFGGPGGGLDPVNLLSLVVVLAVVALLATLAPAARALRISPLEALRAE